MDCRTSIFSSVPAVRSASAISCCGRSLMPRWCLQTPTGLTLGAMTLSARLVNTTSGSGALVESAGRQPAKFGSNLRTRVVSALVLAPLGILIILQGGVLFKALTLLL